MSEYKKCLIRATLEPIAQAVATAAMFAGLLAMFVIFA